MIWSSSGFRMDRSVPFANLIRQMIMFNREENLTTLNQCRLNKMVVFEVSGYYFHLVQRSQTLQ